MLPSAENMQSMSGFVHFFVLASDLSYVTTRNLDVLILGCIVDPIPPLSVLFRPIDRSGQHLYFPFQPRDRFVSQYLQYLFSSNSKNLGGVRVFDKPTELATWRAL